MQDKTNAPTDVEIAWAAGLFEGEGCLNVYARASGKLQVQMRLAMTDFDVVDRFAEIVGCGHLRVRHGAAHMARGDKPLREWYLYEAARVIEIAELLLPHLGARRAAKAREVMALAATVQVRNGDRTHCPRGHEYAGDNLVVETDKHGKTRRICRECRRTKDRERARRRLGTKPENFRV